VSSSTAVIVGDRHLVSLSTSVAISDHSQYQSSTC